ncbi:hypothetical protein Sjap_021475 [Stephania japonica]|uniref:Cytochrome P450 n=1 Tax=Stephania japonica TaxID=461633 RepID=A0AAP0EU87_9MAGN
MESYIILLVQAIAAALVTFLPCHQLWCLRRKVRKITKSSSFNGKGAVVVNKSYAPEPPGAWPIIGHLPLLVSAKQPHRAFAALAEEYGPAFMLRMGMSSPMLIVSSREVAKECYTAKDHVFATRPTTTAGKLMAYDHSVMGFTPFGTYWREIRKIATVELFSARRIGMLKPVRQSEVSLWMKGLHEKWAHNGKTSVSVELKSQLEELTFNLLMQMVAGKRYYGSNVAKSDEKMAGLFRHAVQQFNYHLGNSEMYDALPFMAWLDFKGDAKAMKNTQKDLDYIMQTWLDEHRVKADQMRGDAINNTRDFLDVLVMMEKTGQFSSAIKDIDTTIKALALTQLVAGVDSMANTMVWVLALLLKNPEILARAQDELDTKVGKDRLVEESDIPNLNYLQALLKETLRMYPVGPLLVPHEAMEDCHVAGYFVPRGTGLFINAWTIQRDPNVWVKPDRFMPERFLTTNVNMDVKGQSYELLPFGSGRRSCLGVGLALQVMHLTLARILQAFEIKTHPNVGVDLEESSGILLSMLNPLQVLVAPRLPYELFD